MSTLERSFTLAEPTFASFTAKSGWYCVCTYQDAPYFQIYTNPTTRKIYTFCEGDITVESCDDDNDYKNSLRACFEFYDQINRPTIIDARFDPVATARFEALGFGGRVR